ncbi:hypothetical protein [Nostoc sp.]
MHQDYFWRDRNIYVINDTDIVKVESFVTNSLWTKFSRLLHLRLS